MSIKQLLTIVIIFLCTCIAWVILGTSLSMRSEWSSSVLRGQVANQWGGALQQVHPEIFIEAPDATGGKRFFSPAESHVTVNLDNDPKRKGLLWNRTYNVDFKGEYRLENTSPIDQTMFVVFKFPASDAGYENFAFVIDGRPSTQNPKRGEPLTESVRVPAGKSAKLLIAYRTRGLDSWGYSFGDATRIRNFEMRMSTDFRDYNFPVGTSSPTARTDTAKGCDFTWSYPDVIGAQAIGVEVPVKLNPGPVAARITFFAPVSLLFFFAVVVLWSLVSRTAMHPMHFFFLAAGYFAFQLLFAYLVDLIPLLAAFIVAAAVSLGLVGGYLRLAFGWAFTKWVVVAQLAYMVLFSASFFFDGLTGLTVTLGSIATLAILMVTTAKIDWTTRFQKKTATPLTPVAAS
ncbi:MAG: inner membrane CreD family protein [Chthoniobacterales bacterium]